MSEKQEIIQKLLDMQRKFITLEQTGGLKPEDYCDPESGGKLQGYQSNYTDLANQLVEMAHAEKGSKR